MLLNECNACVYEFGPFRLEVAEHRLVRDGRVQPLTSRALDILLLLVQRRGRLIEKNEIMNEVWPDSIVEENNLTVNVSALRKVLGEDKNDHQYIETVRGRGYRFVAKVKIVEAPPAHEFRASEARGEGAARSIAVLPFTTIGGGVEDEYLGVGMADALAAKLSSIESLFVLPSRSVLNRAGVGHDPYTAGVQLGVGVVLDGQMIKTGGHIRATVQLTNCHDGRLLWAEKFDESYTDIFRVQDSISEMVTRALMIELTKEERNRLTKRYTTHTGAYHLYLKGRFLSNKYSKEGLFKSLKCFRRAIIIDPYFALAYSALAISYYKLSSLHASPLKALPKAKAAATKALEMDDALAEAHESLAQIMLWYDHDWPGSERECQRAIELNPNRSSAHLMYGVYLKYMRRFADAMLVHERALELDPLDLQSCVSLATTLCAVRRFDEAIRQVRKALELDQNFVPARFLLGYILTMQGHYAEALAEFRQLFLLEKNLQLALGYIGYIFGVSSRRDEAKDVLKELEELSTRTYVSPYCIAIVYVGLGDKDQVFEWLEKVYEEQSEWLLWLQIGLEFDSLRSDPRFADLLRRVGFTS